MTNNPQAFPSAYRFESKGIEGGGDHAGMTLRDYFAGQALVGFCSRESFNKFMAVDQTVARCYEIADAMLAAREGK